jgi:hypothetical protein
MFQVTKRMLAALLVAAAICAPAASARPIDRVLPPGTVHGFQGQAASSQINSSSEPPVQAVKPSSDGFNWGDAGIGGAAVFTLLSLGTAALLVGRRSRERRPAATS